MRKKKYKPYQIFCCVDDERVLSNFKKFASQTKSGFQQPKGTDLFSVVSKSNAYVFFLDFEAYTSIRDELDERFNKELNKPLIYLVGELPLFPHDTISDWIHIFALDPFNQILKDMNLVRSRLRA